LQFRFGALPFASRHQGKPNRQDFMIDSNAVLHVEPSLRQSARSDWDACANPGWTLGPDGPAKSQASDPGACKMPDSTYEEASYNPFISHDFLLSLEESGSATGRTGWAGRHLILKDAAERPIGIVPCYLKSHSQGEYVFDHGWANAFERAGGQYYPKLQVSVPFTPATGPRLLARPDAPIGTRETLIAGLQALAIQGGASSVHATFLPDEDAEAFDEAGWLARTDQQFHWQNRDYRDFDDFLEAFASRKRKQVKRERREALASGIEIRWLTGRDITEADWDAFFTFYMDTGSRKWGRPYLNRRFFSLLGERMAAAVLLIFAYRNGKPIAGALNMIGSDTLYGRYWGAIEEHPFLHFEVCYHQAVDFALKKGLKRVEAGAQGEHKLARGYLPVTTKSAHFITDPGLRHAVARHLEHERAQVDAMQEILTEAGPFRRNLDVAEDGED
jgi:predicted N-acyltransferase